MSDPRDTKSKTQHWFRHKDDVSSLIERSQDLNGYYREPAVRKLGETGDARAIPYLVIRANDWVPQVRAAAFEALQRMLTPNNASALVTHLPAILRLEDCKRADHRGLIKSIVEFLALPENRAELLRGTDSEDGRTAALAMRVAIDGCVPTDAALVERGLTSRHVNVRAIAIDLLKALDAVEFDRVIELALRDPFMPVRREALQQLLKRDSSRGFQFARRALFDKTVGVRVVALKALVAADNPVEELLAAKLKTEPQPASVVKCILWGFAELGATRRVSNIASWLQDPRPSVRREALIAYTKLMGSASQGVLERALTDTSSTVCNTAARLIVAREIDMDVERLMEIALSGSPNVVHACTRVADRINKWDRLIFILEVYGRHHAEGVRADLFRVLSSWNTNFNASAAQPSERHRKRLPRSLASCARNIDPTILENLHFTLRTNQIATSVVHDLDIR